MASPSRANHLSVIHPKFFILEESVPSLDFGDWGEFLVSHIRQIKVFLPYVDRGSVGILPPTVRDWLDIDQRSIVLEARDETVPHQRMLVIKHTSIRQEDPQRDVV